MASNDSEWANFSLGEDVRSQSRLRQDEAWKEAVTDGRIHISHREANQIHSIEFQEAIQQFRVVEQLTRDLDNGNSLFQYLNADLLQIFCANNAKTISNFYQTCSLANKSELDDGNSAINRSFRICIRKRPLNEFERDTKIYDCIQTRPLHVPTHPNTPLSSPWVTAHDGRKARTGRRIHMTHKHFVFDRVWDESTPNRVVCDTEISRLVEWAQEGYQSTLLCFGQTGTGKTYTLTAALNYVVESLLGQTIEVSFVELHGKYGYDLLANRKVIQIRSDENDKVHLRGCKALYADMTRASYSELLRQLQAALELRACEVTERNPISSRSHAICTINLLERECSDACSRASSSTVIGGSIMLVDLAGSERNFDTTQMTRAQHRESAAINSSLMALKTCFRAYQCQLQKKFANAKAPSSQQSTPNASSFAQVNDPALGNLNPANTSDANIYAPYRASLLTRILKNCFEDDASHRTLVIATVSPCSVDLMHSLNTIGHVLNMSPRLTTLMTEDDIEVFMKGSAPKHLPLSEWTAEHLSNWLAYIENGRFAQLVLPPGTTGAHLCSLSSAGLSSLFEGQLRAARRDDEGVAWVEEGVANRGTNALGSLLWRSLRREEALIAQYQHTMQHEDSHQR